MVLRFGPEIIAALESVDTEVDGNMKLEMEYEIYGKLVEPSELEKADRKEQQEQWGIPVNRTEKNAGDGNIRVRCYNDGERYILTSKVKSSKGNFEVELESTADQFKQFKMLADTGLKKTRYYFDIPDSNMVYEVDVFTVAGGEQSPWVKIDLEVPKGFNIDDLPDLPLQLDSIRVIAPGRKKDEDRAFVSELFETFNLPNEYLSDITA